MGFKILPKKMYYTIMAYFVIFLAQLPGLL